MGTGKRSGSGVWLLLAAVACAAGWYGAMPTGPAEATFVEIAPGSSTSQIAAELEHSGVIRSQYVFDALRLWKRGRLKAGEYQFAGAATVASVYDRIARGDVYTISVTIPEGANRFEIGKRLEQAGLGTADGFVTATVSERGIVANMDPEATSLEGYLFPDTYRFGRRMSEAQMAEAMVHRFRVEALLLGLTSDFHRVVTLASLVEKETAVASERPLVASVLVNRLSRGMPLMTDPAVIYGLELSGQWRRTIYASDLSDSARDTAYNTYRHAGLPPGPVSNPGSASLRAVMHPEVTDYLYFVAAGSDPQGQSRFATTLDEHQKNVAMYRQAVKQAGKQTGQQAGQP
uniref:Aminodeoxychorismate lyase n=1 Tax=mine drainage metagenome TaxID=410659 RepID=E6QLN5_9ZZZZ